MGGNHYCCVCFMLWRWRGEGGTCSSDNKNVVIVSVLVLKVVHSIFKIVWESESQSTYIYRAPQCMSPRWGWGVPIPTTGETLSTLPTLWSECNYIQLSLKKLFSMLWNTVLATLQILIVRFNIFLEKKLFCLAQLLYTSIQHNIILWNDVSESIYVWQWGTGGFMCKPHSLLVSLRQPPFPF